MTLDPMIPPPDWAPLEALAFLDLLTRSLAERHSYRGHLRNCVADGLCDASDARLAGDQAARRYWLQWSLYFRAQVHALSATLGDYHPHDIHYITQP